MLGNVQTVPMEELMKHQGKDEQEEHTKLRSCSNATTVVNVYSEDDFDEQFEALSAALAEEE